MENFEDHRVRDQKAASAPEQSGPVALEYLHDVVYILAAVLILFTFCIRMVVVSGSSMFDTLVDGDYLLLLNRPLCGSFDYGDIVVAAKDRFNDGEAIVKRVIATEGQTVDIDFEKGVVIVDGEPLREDYTYTATNLEEGTEFPLVVEKNCVFLMGDNRNGSLDSRDPVIGQVDRREILGKVLCLVLPGTGENSYQMPRDFSRIGVID